MQVLKTFRDFVNDEMLKWLPSHLQVHSCMLLEEHKSDKKVEGDKTIISNYKIVLHVFSESGVLIGTINDPHWIPKTK